MLDTYYDFNKLTNNQFPVKHENNMFLWEKTEHKMVGVIEKYQTWCPCVYIDVFLVNAQGDVLGRYTNHTNMTTNVSLYLDGTVYTFENDRYISKHRFDGLMCKYDTLTISEEW